MKNNGKILGKIVMSICFIGIIITTLYFLYDRFGQHTSRTYEIDKDTLYIRTEISMDKCLVSIGNNRKFQGDYIEFDRHMIRNHISNLYFCPPDTIYVLNVDGKTVSRIESHNFKIIDVLSEDVLVKKDSDLIVMDRIRYKLGDKDYERYAPGSPRIAYKLTYDSILCRAPLWISLEPNLQGLTLCDSTGHAIAIY